MFDGANESLTGAAKLPARFGGGYLFWTAHELFRATSFGGALKPLVHVADTVLGVSFGPRVLAPAHEQQ